MSSDNGTAFLNAKMDIMSYHDLVTVSLWIPEWNMNVRVSVMSGYLRDKWETDMVLVAQDGSTRPDIKKLSNIRARLAAYTLVDEEGNRIFVTEKDIEELGSKNSIALDRIYDAAMKLNALQQSDVEELVGN